MKKEYKDLELEVVDFAAEDVITASGAVCEEDEEAICICDYVYECSSDVCIGHECDPDL